MKRILCLIIVWLSLLSTTSCNFDNGNNGNDGSIVGTWCEYRDDGDDYLLASIVFNSDGSGVYMVEGMTNTQQVPFTWSLSGQKVYLSYEDGETTTLSYNQGLIIEHSGLLGEIVFKKR